MEDDYGEVDRGEEFAERDIEHQDEDFAEAVKEDNAEENDLTSMFADIEMKLKAIAETLQGQIEEIRKRIEALENK